MIKLLAMDVDGTLFNSQSRISKKNEDAVRKCLSRGIKVAVVTGQSLWSAKKTIDYFSLTSPQVVSNGALVVGPKLERLYYQPLAPQTYKKVVEFVRKLNLHLIVSTLEGHAVYDWDPQGLFDGYTIKKVDDVLSGDIISSALICTIVTEDRSLTSKAEAISSDIKVRHAGLNFINIFDRRVGKTYGLKKIMEYLDLSADEVMAIGDGENDLGMIKTAGIGVAMGNASSALKQAADYVTAKNDDDGFCLALEEFLLN